jgi:hypothetical protein
MEDDPAIDVPDWSRGLTWQFVLSVLGIIVILGTVIGLAASDRDDIAPTPTPVIATAVPAPIEPKVYVATFAPIARGVAPVEHRWTCYEWRLLAPDNPAGCAPAPESIGYHGRAQ